MKAQDFKDFVAQLDVLSEVQRKALMAALKAEGSVNEVVALIETQFAAAPCCGHCKSERIKLWGHASGLRRYKCRDCGRTFNALTGTPLARLQRRDAWLDYARAMVDCTSLRKAATRAKVCLDTSFRWRHRFLAAPREKRPSEVTGIVEVDETVFLKSQKGARNVVGRAPRKRGGKAARPGISPDDYDIVLIVRDRHKATADYLLPDLKGLTFEHRLDPIVDRDSVLVSDGRPCYKTFAQDRGMDHIAIVARRGEHVKGSFHIQNVNSYITRLKDWLRPFKGVASKYRASYLGWRRMIERDGDRLTPLHLIAEAIGA